MGVEIEYSRSLAWLRPNYVETEILVKIPACESFSV